jgi:replication-associated recombination protein RarA
MPSNWMAFWFFLQEHIVGEGKLLRRTIESDHLFFSIILWGPPGIGKTTLVQVIANTTKAISKPSPRFWQAKLICESSSMKPSNADA